MKSSKSACTWLEADGVPGNQARVATGQLWLISKL